MSENDRIVFGGVDTHRDTHVAAVVDATGRVLSSAPFRADVPGYERLNNWLGSWGRVAQVGIEGTGGPPGGRSAISPPGRGRVLCPGLPPLLTDPPRRSVLGQEQPLPQIRVLPSPSPTSPLINPERLSGSSQSQEGLPACS